jgi:hypothetical protein
MFIWLSVEKFRYQCRTDWSCRGVGLTAKRSNTHQALRVPRSAFVLVLVLVLERCCLQKRRVNPIRSAFSELHPAAAGLKVLVRRFVLVLVLESWRAE